MRRAAIKSALIVAALAFCSSAGEANVVPSQIADHGQLKIAPNHAAQAVRVGHRQSSATVPADAHPFATEFFFADRPQSNVGKVSVRAARD